MKTNIFIYIISNFLLLQLLSLQSELTTTIIYTLCLLGILTLGIAHGAIDNILYGTKPGKSNARFILNYILIILFFAGVWLVFPNLAFGLFLAVSSYHFGQSQFIEYNFRPKILSKFLFLCWGSLVILSMFHFNGAEFLVAKDAPLYFSEVLNHIVEHASLYLMINLILFVFTFLALSFINKLSLHYFFKEIYILLLIGCSMYIFPAFIAFSLFFVWIHSLSVIMQEFEYCKDRFSIKKNHQFIRLFLPLTICSLLGTLAILVLIFICDKTHFIPYALLILLSSITIPHSLVMEKFYRFIS